MIIDLIQNNLETYKQWCQSNTKTELTYHNKYSLTINSFTKSSITAATKIFAKESEHCESLHSHFYDFNDKAIAYEASYWIALAKEELCKTS